MTTVLQPPTVPGTLLCVAEKRKKKLHWLEKDKCVWTVISLEIGSWRSWQITMLITGRVFPCESSSVARAMSASLWQDWHPNRSLLLFFLLFVLRNIKTASPTGWIATPRLIHISSKLLSTPFLLRRTCQFKSNSRLSVSAIWRRKCWFFSCSAQQWTIVLTEERGEDMTEGQISCCLWSDALL